MDDTARTARTVFNQSLAIRTRGGTGRQARRRAAATAAHDAARATGAEVTLGAPASAGRRSSYPVRGGGRLSIVVSTTPVANATRSALLMGLGIGAGVVLVLVSLLVAGIDRVVATPLGRFADVIRRVAGGDATARADEDGPREVREAAAGFNSLLAKVTEQRRRLAAAAASDPLTGVTNNQQFHESLGIELKRAQRNQAAVSLVVIDIDGFGSINDAHGRGFGDEVLQRVAEQLRGMLRATDLLARIGGDDFALILPGRGRRARRRDRGASPQGGGRGVDGRPPDRVLGRRGRLSRRRPRRRHSPPARQRGAALGQVERPRPDPPLRPRAGVGADRPGGARRDRGPARTRAAGDPVLPASRLALHGQDPRLRGALALSRPARPRPRRLVRPGGALWAGRAARGGRPARRSGKAGPPGRHLPLDQREPEHDLLGGGPCRSPRRHDRPRGGDHRARAGRRPGRVSSASWRRCASAARRSPSTTPAPATPGSSR